MVSGAFGTGGGDCSENRRPEYAVELPALLVELKWNQKAVTALQQIRDRKYTQAVEGYMGKMLLVGISYDKKSKEHSCVIEEYTVQQDSH